ncbi:MAG: YbaN family protein [Bacteroidales bacterium]|nr:YbaN family protein [Bacteroidales bacterium]
MIDVLQRLLMHRKNTPFLIRVICLCAGWLFTVLAFLGVFLPLLPTTPFLLGAAACFYRSSDRFYHWIMDNKYFGHYLRNYKAGRGIPLRIKILALAFTWSSTLFSAIFIVPWLWLKIFLIAISVAVTIHLSVIKTSRSDGT